MEEMERETSWITGWWFQWYRRQLSSSFEILRGAVASSLGPHQSWRSLYRWEYDSNWWLQLSFFSLPQRRHLQRQPRPSSSSYSSNRLADAFFSSSRILKEHAVLSPFEWYHQILGRCHFLLLNHHFLLLLHHHFPHLLFVQKQLMQQLTQNQSFSWVI